MKSQLGCESGQDATRGHVRSSSAPAFLAGAEHSLPNDLSLWKLSLASRSDQRHIEGTIQFDR